MIQYFVLLVCNFVLRENYISMNVLCLIRDILKAGPELLSRTHLGYYMGRFSKK